MQNTANAGVVLYAAGVIGFLGLVLAFVYQTRARRRRKDDKPAPTTDSSEVRFLRVSPTREGELPLLTNALVYAPVRRSNWLDKDALGDRSIGELSMDVSLGLLEATRGQERRLTQAKAEELLNVLRDELAIAPRDLTPLELVQVIRARLISLTEMMSEAQLSLIGLEHRVSDIDAMVRQLPAIVNDHRRHIGSLHEAIDGLTAKAATKQDLQQLQKELDVVKWAIATVLAIILAVLGALLKKAI